MTLCRVEKLLILELKLSDAIDGEGDLEQKKTHTQLASYAMVMFRGQCIIPSY